MKTIGLLLRPIPKLHLPDPSCKNLQCSKQQQHLTPPWNCSSFSFSSSRLSSDALDKILLIIRDPIYVLESALSCNCSHNKSLMAFYNVLTGKIIWWYRRITETSGTSGTSGPDHEKSGKANRTIMSLGLYTLQPEQQRTVMRCIILNDMERRLVPILARLRNVSTTELRHSADDLIVRCDTSSLQ